jgi:hypothetical protein
MSDSMASPAVSGESPHRDRVAIALGRRLGLLPNSAAQVLKGHLAYRVQQVILAFDETHEFQRRDRWLLPIHAALQGVANEPLSRELWIRAQQADAQEEVAEAAYHTDPNPATRDQLIRALDHQITTSLAVRDALVRERQAEVA